MNELDAINYIRCCEGYREYPFNNLRHIALVNILSKLRYMLEIQLARVPEENIQRIIFLQHRLNQLPVYLCPYSTMKLHMCKRMIYKETITR